MAARRRTLQKAAAGFIPPLDPTQRDAPPTASGWIHEIKWDGYRAQAHLRDGKVTVYSRSGLDWTAEFDTVSKAVTALRAKSAVLDGEVVVIGPRGKPDFQALRRELGVRSDRLQYYAFDLLELDGEDLRPRPLLDRKAQLEKLLRRAPKAIRYVEHYDNDAREVMAQACEMGLEGIVSKKADSPYKAGRQESWIKSKCKLTDNFPIVGFVEKLGARPRRIASLYVGRREGDRLLYGGKIQTGFTMAQAEEVREALDPFIQRASPFSEPVHKPKATWVKPVVEAEVAFSAKTDEGLLRHGIFKGLREDLAPAKVRPPRRSAASIAVTRKSSKPEARHGVPAENILQLLHGAVAPDLDALEAYWRRIGPKALKYLGRRPLKLVRNVGGTIFYHKGKLPSIPEAVHALQIEKREGGEGVRVWVDDVDGLVALARAMDAVELHPWNAAVDDIEFADQVVLDLDPGEGIELPFVVDTALRVRELMKEEGLKPWPKVTGGKGYHVMAAMTGRMTHDQARTYARQLAERIAGKDRRYTTSASMAQRPGHLFIDYLRNGRGSTAIGTWSPRARRGFPIARPVTWKDIEQGILPSAFPMASPLRAARRRSD